MDNTKINVKYQYIAGICVNIITLSYGGFCAWPSASFPVLQSDKSPLETGPMTANDVGWVGAILCLGGALGCIFFAWYADKFGRRKSLMLIVVPLLIGCLIIPFAKSPLYLCVSRFLGGFAGGGVFGTIPIYITEIADNHMRGILGTFLIFFCNTGILIGFILGYFFTYATVAWLLLIPCIIFVLTFSFLPETPQHLIRNSKIEKAEKSFRYFRNIHATVPELPETLKTELEKLKNEEKRDKVAAAEDNTNALKFQDFFTSTSRKAILIGLFLITLNNFCGAFAMLNYTATIFEISKSSLSPNMSAIVVGVIQLFGSYLATTLVERMARKQLLSVSCIGTAFGQISLGTYLYLGILGFDLTTFTWIPLASFSLAILSACIGILPLTFLILSEIMPPKIRNFGCMFCMLCLWLFAFGLLKLVPFLILQIGLHGMVYMFGVFCLGSVIFIYIFIPETRGKSIDEIMLLL